MSIDAIAIRRLEDGPEALPVCACWLNEQWGEAMGHSLTATTDWLRAIVAPGSGEAAFVALDDDRPVGVCLLVDCDLEARAELTPWVAGLYVLPEYRRRRVGSRLLQPVIAAARGNGAAELYLYTHTAESLYRRLGWHLMERFPLDGKDFALMAKPLR